METNPHGYHNGDHQNQPRRVRIVEVSAQMLLEVLRSRPPHVLMCEGVPHDAVGLGIQYNPENDLVRVLYEHESFEPVAPGGLIPVQQVRYTAYQGHNAVSILIEASRRPQAS